ncbi:amino acid adenylation domain-containing protein [Streptomyces sp. NPDC050560]|uniref:amino acid adenylation domain-containing protein n=1 Tax=Streptomyces sp. NPDC050560 TaxID=3365630 RepID=UPI0037951F70
MTGSALRERLIRERLAGGRGGGTGIGRADRAGELPLSWGQRQFWALHTAAPDSTEYLVPLLLRLQGPLDTEAMARAWAALAARHEVLRTTYAWEGPEPRQHIHPPGTRAGAVDFAVYDESGAGGDDTAGTDGAAGPEGAAGDQDARDARVRAVFAREMAVPLDLGRHAPLRVRLVRLAPDDHVLLAVFHHIACDAMTYGIVTREVCELYAAEHEGRAPRLAPVAVQYADYAAWERGRRFDLGYWREQLADAPPLELPTDRPRPAEWDGRGATVPVRVPDEVAARVRELAARHGATGYVVLLTAFQALLARYTGTTDVAVGTAVSARQRPELQDLVGYAFNTLVLRARWEGGSFGDLLAANRNTVLDAFDHADAPFLAVADAVRGGEHRQLFHVMLDLRTDTGPGLALPGLTATALPAGEGVARFDLTLHLHDRDGSLGGDLEYATALFDASTARRIAGHFARFLDRATARPDAPLALLDFLPAQERGLLLPEPRPAPAFRPFRLGGGPDAVAVTGSGPEVTYAELDARANQYAHHLLGAGARTGSVVGVRMGRTPDTVACLLGVWRAGAAYLPIDLGYPDDRVAYMVEDSGARLVVDADTDVSGCPTTPVDHTPDPLDLAYTIYTSGSTGRPKGVAVTHGGLANYLAWAVGRYMSAGPGGAPLLSSIAFDLGVPNLFAPLLTGRPVHLVQDNFDPARLGELLAAGAPYAFVKLTPGHLDLLSRQLSPEQARGLAGLVIAAGDEFPRRLVRRWARLGGPPLAAEYGPTEITVGNSAQFDVAGQDTELVPIGSPIPGTTMYVLDEHLQPTPVGAVGEVHIGGVGLARGYTGRPGQTAERFLPDPYGRPGARLYRTGDLARVLPDGSVDFAGRVDHQVKLRGYRIELDEIEAVLTAEPGVRDAVVVLRDERLVGYVVGDADPGALRERAAAALPPYMVPAALVTLDALPLTANGKTDRRALPAPGREELTGSGYRAPSGPAQEAVAAVWARVLKVERPGADDSFFDLGGDSISAVGLAGELRAAGLDISVADVFAARTIAGLAELVAAADEDTAPLPTGVQPFALVGAADRAALPPGLVDAFPLSLTQRGMLLEMFTGGDVNRYHNITAFRITDGAPFDPAALQAAVDLVVRRHEVMRTGYDLTSYSVPLQLVWPHAALPVGHTDLRHLEPGARTDALMAHCAAERAVLFDIARPPLMRMHVHLCDDESWWLSITECHPVLEGWSYHSQLMEMLTAYQRLRGGEEPEPREPAPFRYADFVATELRALDDPADQEYWRGVLTDHTAFTVPPALADPAGGTRRYQLAIPFDDLEERLRALATRAGAPFKSVLHAAHLHVLGMLTPDESFHSGVVCDGRPELPGFERVSGMFLNSVPFPHRRGARSWRELVERTFGTEIRMWPHRHFPMPAMPALVDGGRPVDVLFHYLDFHQVDRALVDVEACIDDSPNEFRLVVGTPMRGRLSIAGTPEVLGEDRAARLAGLYRAVLEAMATDPEGDPRALALPGSPRLTGPGRHADDLGDLLAAGAPGDAAVIADGRTHTFADLARRADRVAHRLHTLGAGPDTTVGVLLDRGVDLVAALLGVLRAGAAYVPLDPAHPTAALRDQLVGTALVVTCAGHAARIGDREAVLVEELPDAPPVAHTADPESLAYVLHTSGSTGRPHAVGVTRRALANYLAYAAGSYAAGGTSRVGAPVFSSVAFDITVPNLFAPLLAGLPVCLLPQDLDPADLGTRLREHAPYRFMMLTASHFSLLLSQLGAEETAGLAAVTVSAGEPLGADAARLLPGLRVEYGPTETTVGVAGEPVDGRLTAPLGTPLPGTVLQLLDAGLLPVPVGAVGELCVGGTGLARGYLGAPGRTAARFVPDPYGPPGARLYRTGDLARMTEEGRLEFVGRADDQAKVRGHRVDPARTEAALLADPRVERAAVTVRDGRLVGYLVTAAEPAAVRDTLARVLPDHQVPTVLVAVPELPLTGNGKLDRRALPAPPAGGAATGRPPRSAMERALAEVWGTVLGTEVTDVGTTLHDAGADSLALLTVLATAARRGLDVPRDLLRAGATLEETAAHTRGKP